MGQLVCVFNRFHNALFNRLQCFDGLAPLALRLYLVPVFWMAGTQKIDMATFLPFDYTVQWFDDGLGLPFPYVMAFSCRVDGNTRCECVRSGLATHWISIFAYGDYDCCRVSRPLGPGLECHSQFRIP
ncbi:MAG: DoxX family protein [Porticoccaceae bacterium]